MLGLDNVFQLLLKLASGYIKRAFEWVILSMNKSKCLYCQQEKDSAEYSLEHIFPDALGGSLFPQVFKTRDVCRHCNSTSGLFIDGPFIKNFFSQNDRSQAYLNYINFNKPVAMPLKYLGVLEDFTGEDNEVCEVWFGPHGGIVYHVRQKADPRYDTMIGGNPIENKKNNGWIAIFAQNSDVYWNEVLLLSCIKYFGKARRISGGIQLTPQAQHNAYFNEPTDKELSILQFFRSISGRQHHCKIQIQIGFEQRFLAKLALGLGYNLFGNKFLNSEYSQKLRNAMWEKDFNKRLEIVNFSDYFHDGKNIRDNFLAWEGVHTLVLFPIGSILYLIFYCFGYKLMMIPLCYDHEIWNTSISSDGIVYVAAPQLELFSVPLSSVEFISHKTGYHRIAKLEEIEQLKNDISQLPKITDYSTT